MPRRKTPVTYEMKRGMLQRRRRGDSLASIARHYGVTRQTVERTVKHTRAADVPKYVPTPEDIAEGCAEIREGWDEEEYFHRLGGKGSYQEHIRAGVEAKDWSRDRRHNGRVM